MASSNAMAELVLSFTGDVSGIRTAVENVDKLLSKASRDFERGLTDIKNQFGNLAGALAGYFTVDAFAGLVKSSVLAAGALDDMAERTGSTVEQLSKLADVGKLSNKPLEDIALLSDKLAKGMSGLDKETSSANSALTALGISARDAQGNFRPTAELIEEVAVRLGRYADNTSKAIILQDLFGKSGAAAAPFLRDLADNISMVGSVTTQQAADAEAFEKALVRISIAGQQAMNVFTQAILPTLKTFALTVLEATTQSGGLLSTVRGLASDGSLSSWAQQAAISVATLVDAAQGLYRMLEILGTILAATAAYLQGFALMAKGGAEIMSGQLLKGVQDVQAGFELMRQSVKGGTADISKVLEKPFFSEQLIANMRRAVEETRGFTPALQQLTLAYKGAGNASDEYQKSLDKLLDRLENSDTSVSQEFWKNLAMLNKEFASKNPALYASLVEELIKQTKFGQAEFKKLTDAATAQNKAFDDSFEAIEKERIAKENSIKSARLMVENLEFEAQALLMTNKEREIAIALRNLELDGIKKGSKEYEIFAERIRAAVEQKDALQAQINVWRDIDQVARDTFVSIFESGKDAFTRLRDTLKNTLFDLLYKMTLRKWIFQIGAAVTGVPADALAGTAGGAGGGIGNMLSLLGLGGTGSGGAGIFGFLNSIGSSAISSLGNLIPVLSPFLEGSAAFVGPLAAGTELMAGASVLAPFLTAIAPAIPVIGSLIALAGVFGLFGEGGGPKSGGFAQSAGLGLERYFTPSDQDSALQELVKGAEGSFNELIMALGGTSEALFAFGFDTDPEGTAPNRINAQVFIDGKEVWKQFNVNFGRGEADLQAGIEETTKKAILAALQNSDLSEELLAILNSINVDTATEDQIDNILEVAQAFKHMSDAAAALNDVLAQDTMLTVAQVFAQSQQTALQAFVSQGYALSELASQTIESVEGFDALTKAAGEFYTAQIQLLVQIEQLKVALSGMFADTAENIRTSMMTEDERYTYYMQRTDELYDQLQGETDPDKIREIAEQINDYVNRAWALLTPEERASLGEDFLTRLNGVDQIVQGQLDVAEGIIQATANEILTNASEVLDKFVADYLAANTTQKETADKNLSAADKMLLASDKMQVAVNTPVTVVVSDTRVNA